MSIWKKVPGWPYEVSDLGLVRRIGKTAPLKPMWTGQKRKQYAAVRLCMGQQQVDFKVHRLVCELFHGPCPPGMWALHKDDDTKNNSAANVYWGTPEDNAETMAKRNYIASVAATIRSRRAAGEKGRALAAEYGISEQMVCGIYKGRNYDFV